MATKDLNYIKKGEDLYYPVDTKARQDIENHVNSDHLTNDDITFITGLLADLSTSEKETLVDAINELVTTDYRLSQSMGQLSTLATTNKTSIVLAINELKTTIANNTIELG